MAKHIYIHRGKKTTDANANLTAVASALQKVRSLVAEMRVPPEIRTAGQTEMLNQAEVLSQRIKECKNALQSLDMAVERLF